MSPKEIVKQVLSKWRSSDRYIPGGILREEADLHLTPKLRNELADARLSAIIQALKNPELQADKGTVENILKIRQITLLSRKAYAPFVNFDERPIHGMNDEVRGLEQARLDDLVKEFPDQSKFAGKTFSLKTHLLVQLSKKHAIDNDLYAFIAGGIIFTKKLHEGVEVVAEVSSRGANQYPYLVTGGQDQVIDILENTHFNRFEIEELRRRIDPRFNIDPAYWEYLRKWRFKGRVVGLPVGTIAFSGEPVLQKITDPISYFITESLTNPWMSSGTNLLTNAVRLLVAKGKIPVITEAGTRRVITGNLSAAMALLAGANGTSNVLTAMLLGGKAYGTTAHALIKFLSQALDEKGTEFDAHDTIFSLAKAPIDGVLVDTNNILDGTSTAIRAGGDLMSSIRQDSNVVGPDGKELATQKSIELIQDVVEGIRGVRTPHSVTNDLSAQSLLELGKSDANVSAGSLGGAFAVPEVAHGNFVYKMTEIRVGERTSFPIKVANGAKSTRPGFKRIFRSYDGATGVMKGDQVQYHAQPDYKSPSGDKVKSPQVELFGKDGRIVPRTTPEISVPYIAAQVAEMPAELKDPTATVESLKASGKMYPVQFSPELEKIRKEAIERVTPKKEYRVLVVPGTFGPALEKSHMASVKRVAKLVRDSANGDGFDRIIFVPTGDSPVHGKNNRLSGDVRIDGLKTRIRASGLKNAEVWTKEVESGGNYTIDTLESIRATLPAEAKITVSLGEDAFWQIGSSEQGWKQAEKLLLNYNFVVVKRDADANDPDRKLNMAETKSFLKWLGFKERTNVLDGPNGTRIQYFNARLPKLSSSVARNFYDGQGLVALTLVTDAQWTFLQRSKIPTNDQKSDGTLSVAGTELTVSKIVNVVDAALANGAIKLSVSNDSHHEVEVEDESQNGEFHGQYAFPQHGMRGRPGPDGDGLITEIKQRIDGIEDVVPAHDQVEVTDESGAKKKKLELVKFDLSELGNSLTSPKRVMRFEKNGVASYSVFVNPRYKEYLAKVDPYKVLPHFHLGWCTDFCDYNVMNSELELGYKVYFVVDAAAGVFPRLTGMRMRELISKGMKVLTTEEYVALVQSWKDSKLDWAEVQNSLAQWEKKSNTMARLQEELKQERYRDLGPGEGEAPGQCAVLLTKQGLK
jgi:nicotinic acid phosphoribosyltransferase/nicotinic acid mononucleotide adenylyltransferase